MEKYILDTNVFFNMESGFGLGNKTEDVVKKVTELANKLKKQKKAEFFMPPRAVEEFLGFFENKEEPFLRAFLSAIIVKAPETSSVNFPAAVFYQLVADIRQRSYRGLNIGEEEIENTARKTQGKEAPDKKSFQIGVGQHIKTFRERYRNATRVGFLDSVADLDLIVLSKEQDGFLITTDEGVLRWGRTFGVKEMPAVAWVKRLEETLD
jgi:hypothetical protein